MAVKPFLPGHELKSEIVFEERLEEEHDFPCLSVN